MAQVDDGMTTDNAFTFTQVVLIMATAVQEFNIRVVVVRGNMSAQSLTCALMLFVW